jgi:hypothetical protein
VVPTYCFHRKGGENELAGNWPNLRLKEGSKSSSRNSGEFVFNRKQVMFLKLSPINEIVLYYN